MKLKTILTLLFLVLTAIVIACIDYGTNIFTLDSTKAKMAGFSYAWNPLLF